MTLHPNLVRVIDLDIITTQARKAARQLSVTLANHAEIAASLGAVI